MTQGETRTDSGDLLWPDAEQAWLAWTGRNPSMGTQLEAAAFHAGVSWASHYGAQQAEASTVAAMVAAMRAEYAKPGKVDFWRVVADWIERGDWRPDARAGVS